MDNFINRKKELEILEREYKSDKSSMVIVYGRRRLGKSSLIKKFKENLNSIYYEATEESEDICRKNFQKLASAFVHIKTLATADVSWYEIFESIVNYPTATKKLIIIDEFQYIGVSNKAFPSIFQNIWDNLLESSNVMVILCGSHIGMMESQTLNYSSPLYGRRTGQIRLNQLNYSKLKEFFPNKTDEELIEYYGVLGGTPYYLNTFQKYDDLFEGIKLEILNPNSRFNYEPNFLLQTEVQDVGSYFSILNEIAKGNRKVSSISSGIQKKETHLSKYLSILIEMDFLEKIIPVTESHPEKSKKGIYKLKDNFINFWFKYVLELRNTIGIEASESDIQNIKDTFYTGYLPYIYEDVCLQKCKEFSQEGISPFYGKRIGKFWDKNCEIDLVGINRQSNECFIGECKYSKNLVGIPVYNELIKKGEYLKSLFQELSITHYVFFGLSGFTEELISLAKTKKNIALVKCVTLLENN